MKQRWGFGGGRFCAVAMAASTTTLQLQLGRAQPLHSDALLRDADIYVNGLFANAPQHGAALLCANVSRSIMTLALAPEQVRTMWSVAHVMSVPRKLPFRQLSTRRATCDVEHVHLP